MLQRPSNLKKQGIKVTDYLQKQRKTSWNNGIFAKISYEIFTVHKIHMQFNIDKNNILYSKMAVKDFLIFLLKLKCLQRALSSCELKWRSGRSLASDEKFGRSKTDLSSSCSRLLDALDNQPRSRLPLTFSRSTRFHQYTFHLFVLFNSRSIFIKEV